MEPVLLGMFLFGLIFRVLSFLRASPKRRTRHRTFSTWTSEGGRPHCLPGM